MKGAVGFVIGAGFYKLHVAADNVNYVQAGFDLFDGRHKNKRKIKSEKLKTLVFAFSELF